MMLRRMTREEKHQAENTSDFSICALGEVVTARHTTFSWSDLHRMGKPHTSLGLLRGRAPGIGLNGGGSGAVS